MVEVIEKKQETEQIWNSASEAKRKRQLNLLRWEEDKESGLDQLVPILNELIM